MQKDLGNSSDVIKKVSSYISESGDAKLPAEVIKSAKIHILDTMAAMVSGSNLKPGHLAKRYVSHQSGALEAQVVGSQIITSAVNAAFANGVMAHADETDDSNPRSLTHPGCAIVPAALAMAEREEANGICFLNGVVAGYDIGSRIIQALGIDNVLQLSRSTHSIGGNFGASAAATSVARLKETEIKYVLSYTAQQASGLGNVLRDQEHIEKAVVFAGIPARNGVTATTLIQSGFTGVYDTFSGKDNFFEAFSQHPSPELLIEELGIRYEIMFTSIKKFSVGSPIQGPLNALLFLMEKHGLTSENIQSITARLHHRRAQAVSNREMPDINLHYILAVTLLEGNLTFEKAHSYERMTDADVLEIKKIITVVGDHELDKDESILEITTKDGTSFKERVTCMRGTYKNPLTVEEVEKKCWDLIVPTLGKARSQKLIDVVWNLEKVRNMRDLRPLLSAS